MERVEINVLPPIMLNEVAAYGGTILGYNEETNSTVVEIDAATKLELLKIKYPDIEITASTDEGDAGLNDIVEEETTIGGGTLEETTIGGGTLEEDPEPETP